MDCRCLPDMMIKELHDFLLPTLPGRERVRLERDKSFRILYDISCRNSGRWGLRHCTVRYKCSKDFLIDSLEVVSNVTMEKLRQQ